MSKGRYEVVGRLPPGQGGKTSLAVMGHGAFRRLVVLRPVGEASLIPVANVEPHLPPPLGVEEIEGVSYAVFDFFPGASLHEIVDVYRGQEQLPPLGLAVRVVVDAARVLHLGHEHQDALGGSGAFVHGGISDTSLLLGFDGETRVIDFGLRKMNRFASPEAVHGGPFSPKSDVFSLAAVLHSALTGFDREYMATLARAPSPSQFPPPSTVHPDATQDLDALLMRAMFPDARQRLSSALELADDLERIVGANLPQREACATRLKQLFEERLDGLRNMVPRLSSDSGPQAAPRTRQSRTSLPSMPVVEAPPQPRRSGPRSAIPKGTQPEANPIGKRPTPPEVKAAFGDPTGDELGDESTIVVDSDAAMKQIARTTGEQRKADVTRAERTAAAPSAPKPPERKSSSKKSLAPLPEVPWESGPLGAGVTTGERRAQSGEGSRATGDEEEMATGGAHQQFDEAEPDEAEEYNGAIEDVPTGLSRASKDRLAPVGGSTREEKALARGQELVQTGDLDPEEADDLRDQPTVVKVSGTHQKLQVDDVPEGFEPIDDPEADPGTAVITAKEGPKAKGGGPPMLLPAEPPSDGGPLAAPTTGVMEDPKKKRESASKSTTVEKKRGKGPRRLIAFMLIAMAAGFGYVSLKNPKLVKEKVALARAKVDVLMIKYKLKPPPPPEEPAEPGPPGEPEATAGEDGGAEGLEPVLAPAVAGDGGARGAVPEEDLDGGEDEEDEDGGVLDAGHHADGGVVHKVKHKRPHRGAKQWWKTQ